MTYEEYLTKLTNEIYRLFKQLNIESSKIHKASNESRQWVFELALNKARELKPLETLSNLKSDIHHIYKDIDFYGYIQTKGKRL